MHRFTLHFKCSSYRRRRPVPGLACAESPNLSLVIDNGVCGLKKKKKVDDVSAAIRATSVVNRRRRTSSRRRSLLTPCDISSSVLCLRRKAAITPTAERFRWIYAHNNRIPAKMASTSLNKPKQSHRRVLSTSNAQSRFTSYFDQSSSSSTYSFFC